MNSKIRTLVAASALALGLGGCVTYPGGITGSTVPLNPGSYTEIGEASGSTWGMHLLGILPISEASPQTALDRALTSSGGDALIQTTVVMRIYPLFILNLYQTQVEGTAVTINK